MNVALATIPHTGTHLVREWFRRLGYRQVAQLDPLPEVRELANAELIKQFYE